MTTTLDIAPSARSAAEIGPVRPSERIAELDILRGFALLGIAVLHTQCFLHPVLAAGEQRRRSLSRRPGQVRDVDS